VAANYQLQGRNSPRGKILRLPADKLALERAIEVIPEGNDTIVTNFYTKPTMVATASRLYLIYQMGGPSEVRAFDFSGQPSEAPRQLPIAAVHELTPLEGDDLLFVNVSYVQPGGQYLFQAKTGATTLTSLMSHPPLRFDDIEVAREFAQSKDGTRVPVNILYRRGSRRDGK
jgi:prolyl oligopeptidase